MNKIFGWIKNVCYQNIPDNQKIPKILKLVNKEIAYWEDFEKGSIADDACVDIFKKLGYLTTTNKENSKPYLYLGNGRKFKLPDIEIYRGSKSVNIECKFSQTLFDGDYFLLDQSDLEDYYKVGQIKKRITLLFFYHPIPKSTPVLSKRYNSFNYMYSLNFINNYCNRIDLMNEKGEYIKKIKIPLIFGFNSLLLEVFNQPIEIIKAFDNTVWNKFFGFELGKFNKLHQALKICKMVELINSEDVLNALKFTEINKIIRNKFKEF